jgi:hypothetical protein
MSALWAMEMKAISVEDPARLMRTLTDSVVGCGGWILMRGADCTGTVTMLFKFERQACMDIYSVLVAAGVELGQREHLQFTDLCRCTLGSHRECGNEIASIDLEIRASSSPPERNAQA